MKLKSIKKVGREQQQCILVDSKDHLYVTDNKIITHNTVITGSLTEVSFFKDAGWSDEKIMNLVSKLRNRIDSRLKGNYMGRFILDSSPNSMESPIDNWIFNEAHKDPKNFLIRGPRWKYFDFDHNDNIYEDKELGTIKQDLNVAFPFFKGGDGKPAKVLETISEIKTTDPIDIIWCPKEDKKGLVSYIKKAEETPLEFMRDWAGLPTNSADRIFNDTTKLEKCFNNNLKNIYSSITAPADMEPEHLIWDQIKDVFFDSILDKYRFYYEPDVARVLSVDQSTSKDATCISVSHVERQPDKFDPYKKEFLKCYVTDFTIVIIPKQTQISLDAIKFFIMDLIQIGNLNIRHVSFDNFQSDSTRQFLRRKGIQVEYVSVDKDINCYLSFIDVVNKGRWHCGKNIYVKNNMKSLQYTKRKNTGSMKVDHMNGTLVHEGDSSWEKSIIGQNAKDTCDAITANIHLLELFDNEYIPYKIWNDEDLGLRTYDTVVLNQNNYIDKLGGYS